MFGIGFLELLLLSALALVVVGPKRLPGLLRALGKWIGGARRSLSDIRRQVEDELQLGEIQKELHEATAIREIRETGMSLDQVMTPADESADPSHWPGKPSDGPDN